MFVFLAELLEIEASQLRILNKFASSLQDERFNLNSQLKNQDFSHYKSNSSIIRKETLEKLRISQKDLLETLNTKAFLLSENREKNKKILEEIDDLKLSFKLLAFDLKEQEIQQNLTRILQEIGLNKELKASKALASNLKLRLQILNELVLIESEEKKNDLYREIEEIQKKYEELVSLTDSFDLKDEFEGNEGNLDLELKGLEINKKLLLKIQELKILGEEIEKLQFSIKETEIKRESLEMEVYELEKEENENYMEEIKRKDDFQREIDENLMEKRVFEEKSSEIREKTRVLAKKKVVLEIAYENLLLQIKKKYEVILFLRKRFIDLLQECEEKQRLMKFYLESCDDFLKEIQPLLKVKKETKEDLELFCLNSV